MTVERGVISMGKWPVSKSFPAGKNPAGKRPSTRVTILKMIKLILLLGAFSVGYDVKWD